MKLAIVKCDGMEDWYLIERAEHDGREWYEEESYTDGAGNESTCTSFCTSARFSDADVEGYGDQMLAIAEAIERRDSACFKRCAVEVRGDSVAFCSPRNSRREGVVTLAEADDLAAKIRAMLGGASAAAGA